MTTTLAEIRLVVPIASAIALCASAVASVPPSPPAAIAIEHVTVLPMTHSGAVIEDATVLVRAGRIEVVGPAASVRIPRGVRRIPASGKWLMPALSDMHVHVENERLVRLWSIKFAGSDELGTVRFDSADILIPYVAAGVLQIQNMSAMQEDIARKKEVESGRVLGPHMALAAMVDGSPPIWPPGMTRVATTPEAGREIVRDIKAEGFDGVKVYSNLTLDTFTAIVDEARQQNLKVLGHLPERRKGLTGKLLIPGFGMVAHAEEYAYQSTRESDEEIEALADLAKRTGTWLCSTLRTNELIAQQARDPGILDARPEYRTVHPVLFHLWKRANPYTGKSALAAEFEAIVDFNRRLVRAFVAAGVPIVPGTDTLIPGTVPGVTLHEEFAALVAAGMSPEQVLVAATRQSAEWLGVAVDRGTVEQGKRADLLLLDADPRAAISNTREIAAVVRDGRYMPREELDEMLAELVARYRQMPDP